MEIEQSDGDVLVLVAERPPEILDDDMKKIHFQECLASMTADETYERIPCTLPKRNHTSVPGVSRFPIEEWTARGSPTLTQAGWVALCWIVGQKDPQNLEHLLDLCDKSPHKQDGDPAGWHIVQCTGAELPR